MRDQWHEQLGKMTYSHLIFWTPWSHYQNDRKIGHFMKIFIEGPSPHIFFVGMFDLSPMYRLPLLLSWSTPWTKIRKIMTVTSQELRLIFLYLFDLFNLADIHLLMRWSLVSYSIAYWRCSFSILARSSDLESTCLRFCLHVLGITEILCFCPCSCQYGVPKL